MTLILGYALSDSFFIGVDGILWIRLICPPLAWADAIIENDIQHNNTIILVLIIITPIFILFLFRF
jgi:hypothetical protein